MEWKKTIFLWIYWNKLHRRINIGERMSCVAGPSAQSESDVVYCCMCFANCLDTIKYYVVMLQIAFCYSIRQWRPGTCHRRRAPGRHNACKKKKWLRFSVVLQNCSILVTSFAPYDVDYIHGYAGFSCKIWFKYLFTACQTVMMRRKIWMFL